MCFLKHTEKHSAQIVFCVDGGGGPHENFAHAQMALRGGAVKGSSPAAAAVRSGFRVRRLHRLELHARLKGGTSHEVCGTDVGTGKQQVDAHVWMTLERSQVQRR